MFCIDYLCVNEKYMFIHEDRQPHFQILFLTDYGSKKGSKDTKEN